jgi:predicted dehydrogenase/NADPH:quinone reductase-like Zn-dependent oxidoreductase
MKQVAQRMRDGRMNIAEVPPPTLGETDVLVRAHASIVSAGTERAKVGAARDSLVGKARRRPDEARKVLDKVRRDGLGETIAEVRNRLDALAPLGYCLAGRVVSVGRLVRDIAPGDLVACGGDTANHAEVVAVPSNLVARVPREVSIESAAFTTLGSIALHGFRQAEAVIGERVAVVGMGLVGLLSARIARAAGCHVVGIDLDPGRLALARETGSVTEAYTRSSLAETVLGRCDAVLVTAAAPQSSDPARLAVELLRDRGRIVVVGDVKLDLERRTLYEKEIELRLARSYGPGRYDKEYEERGLDYPIGYVRWTERRNMDAVLAMIARNDLVVADLISHRFPIDDAVAAFDLLADRTQESLAVLITYDHSDGANTEAVASAEPSRRARRVGANVGFIGAGNFAQRHLIPLARKHGLVPYCVATSSGLTAASVAERFEFSGGARTVDQILADDDVSAVVVATRHDRHAELVLAALRAGKAVFCEKPLCLSTDELDAIEAEASRPGAPPLMVGFNRRHAPLVSALETALPAAGPAQALIRVNAGRLADDHWLNDPHEGGGRLVGEGCHFFDLLVHLVGAAPTHVAVQGHAAHGLVAQSASDFVAAVRFENGSVGTILYGSSGSRRLGKEYIELHRGSRSAQIDDFARLTVWADGRPSTTRSRARDKGIAAEVALFSGVVTDDRLPPALETYLLSMRLTLAARRSLETGREESVAPAVSS